MDMIERYIYAVTQKVPQSQRSDIGMELRGLIEDMLEGRTGQQRNEEDAIEEVLLELGSPGELAAQYRGSKHYLISPELFHSYTTLLKIVLLSISIAMGVVFIIESIMDPQAILNHFIGLITSFFNAGIHAFAWITIGFAVADYKAIIPEELKHNFKGEWKPTDLPPIPDEKKQIKRGETIVGIVFSLIFIVLIISASGLLGIPIVKDDTFAGIIPFFNQTAINTLLPFIYVFLGISILKECLKLISGKWTKKLALYYFFLNIASIGLLFVIFKDQMIWNPTFMDQLSQVLELKTHSNEYAMINDIWQRSTQWILIIFIAGILIETVSVFYKAYRK
ncbi:hypothetical protein [Lentibacillus saliphilus]|uniref:hypothetical protein n=1 Tax=Lentibacillus saliphilus TaxID=2737028 RepID=UPI001C302A49|nr:hypothetical protein [Lentibacillus saliphilus]